MRAQVSFVFLVLIAGATAAAAANTAEPPQRGADLYEGIVVDQTITRQGQEFYRLFVGNWRDQPLSERYTISLREYPSARLGSQVIVSFGTRRLFQAQLSPNRSQLKAASENAVDVVYQAVTEGELQRLLFRDLDLGQDEI
jgi:curli production assembly/transport component CsgE